MAKAIRWWSVALILTLIAYGVRFWFQPVVVVVPHHDVVAALRYQLLSFVANRRITTKRIVLISTDHFGKNQHRILTSPKSVLASTIAADNLAIISDHGIMNLLSDIQTLFPQATVDPLLVGSEVRESELLTLLNEIQSICGQDCLVVASVDFSHYLPAAVAMTHDQYSIHALLSFDYHRIWNSETDSPQTLWLAAKLASIRGATGWKTFAQTNSSVLIDDPWYESTSHVFGWYQRGYTPHQQLVTTFTSVQATSSAQLTSLGKRLLYGSETDQSLCIGLSDGDSVITGWETPHQLFIGILPLELNESGYRWKRQLTQAPPLLCNKKVVLLPGTTD